MTRVKRNRVRGLDQISNQKVLVLVFFVYLEYILEYILVYSTTRRRRVPITGGILEFREERERGGRVCIYNILLYEYTISQQYYEYQNYYISSC